jgi:hypothetical protein
MKHPAIIAALPFINGGAAGMIATSIIQPVDMVKVIRDSSLLHC